MSTNNMLTSPPNYGKRPIPRRLFLRDITALSGALTLIWQTGGSIPAPRPLPDPEPIQAEPPPEPASPAGRFLAIMRRRIEVAEPDPEPSPASRRFARILRDRLEAVLAGVRNGY